MTIGRRSATGSMSRGFTLLELLVALLLTAVAVAIAGSALRTAQIARERVVSHRDRAEKDARVREMLTDMLRHAPSAELFDEPLMQVRRNDAGNARLVFLSQGVRQPFGTGHSWRVEVWSSDSTLSVSATPIGVALGETPLLTTLASSSKLRVEFLDRVGMSAASWRDDWPVEQSRPAMIALHFGSDTNRAPLMVSLDPFAMRTVAMGAQP